MECELHGWISMQTNDRTEYNERRNEIEVY